MNNLEFKESIPKALAWSGMGQVFVQILTLIIGVIIARLLEPRDFGLIAIVVIFSGLASTFANMGVNVIVLKEKNVSRDLEKMLFGLNLLAGILLAAGMLMAGSYIGSLLNDVGIAPLFYAMSGLVVVNSAGAFPRAMLVRRMEQRKIAAASIIGVFAYSIVSVSLAVAGFGAWSLAFGLLVQASFATFLYWKGYGQFVWPKFKRYEVKRFVSFGLQVGIADLLTWSWEAVSNIIISRMLGVAWLGYYSFGQKLAWMPYRKIYETISPVFESVVASVIRQTDEGWAIYRKTLEKITALIWLPLITVYLAAPDLLPIIYGNKWKPSVPVLQAFCIVAAISSIGSMSHQLFPILGRPREVIYLSICRTLLVAVAIVILSSKGLIAVVYGIALSLIIVVVMGQWRLACLMQGNIIEVGRSVTPAVLASISALMAGMATVQFFCNDAPSVSRLVIKTVTVIVVYTSLILILLPDMRRYGISILRMFKRMSFTV